MAGDKSKLELNHATVEQLLKVAVMPKLRAAGNRIAAAAGEGFEVDARVGANRARVTVRTATFEARHAEAKNRTLTKALGAGRG